MRELSYLEEMLIDEYLRCKRNLKIQEEELQNLKKGYISYKKIRGKTYSYLQWREAGKVHSKYIKKDELDAVLNELEMRHKCESSIKNLHRSIKQIEKALGKSFIEECIEGWE